VHRHSGALSDHRCHFAELLADIGQKQRDLSIAELAEFVNQHVGASSRARGQIDPARSAAFSAATAPAMPEFAIATTGFTPSRCFQAPSTTGRPEASDDLHVGGA
jgi:hypothetical protein